MHAALWSAAGQRLAFTTADLPSPFPGTASIRWLTSPVGATLAVPLADGRRLVIAPRHFPRPAAFVTALIALAGLLALASLPVARLVTRRLVALEAGVRRLGEGALDTRVEVRGSDELAALAHSFNLTAERLQALVAAQRRVLASASHELRSPLARLRMMVELAREEPASARGRLDQAVAEIGELDTLIEELLLAGRLELQPPSAAAERVDVGDLLAVEAARTGARAEVRPAPIAADPRVLRVLLRNLLENAGRYGGGCPVEAAVEPLSGERPGVRLTVADRGPGVPDAERGRIFEPFYRPPGPIAMPEGGAGLGLYLVDRIARSLGGSAVCHPRIGGGTLFEVVLYDPPRAPNRLVPPAQR